MIKINRVVQTRVVDKTTYNIVYQTFGTNVSIRIFSKTFTLFIKDII